MQWFIVIRRSEPFPYTQVIDIIVESTTVHAATRYNSSDIEQNRQVLMILRRQCKTLPWNSTKAMCLSYVSKDGVRRGRHCQQQIIVCIGNSGGFNWCELYRFQMLVMLVVTNAPIPSRKACSSPSREWFFLSSSPAMRFIQLGVRCPSCLNSDVIWKRNAKLLWRSKWSTSNVEWPLG